MSIHEPIMVRTRNFYPIKFVGLIVFIMLTVVGCAGLPPAQPARDMSAIAGKWQGDFLSQQGRFLSATLTINDDGTYEDLIPGLPTPRFVGTIAVVDGKYRLKSDTSGRMYTVTLHEGDGRRVLKKVPDDSSFSSVQFHPVK